MIIRELTLKKSGKDKTTQKDKNSSFKDLSKLQEHKCLGRAPNTSYQLTPCLGQKQQVPQLSSAQTRLQSRKYRVGPGKTLRTPVSKNHQNSSRPRSSESQKPQESYHLRRTQCDYFSQKCLINWLQVGHPRLLGAKSLSTNYC